MEPRRRRLWHMARECLTHWSIAGAILAITGAAPEHWFAELARELPLPHGSLPSWLAHVDYRLAAVIAGLSIIVGDNLWRHHGSRVPVTTDAAAPSPAPETQVGPPLPDKPSIAVLPFDNLSGDPEQEYFSDGMAEDIITQLSRGHALFVIARNSSFTYKGRAVDVKQIGRELGVRYVLEGSVRRGGERVRISAQLVEAGTGNHIWAERYDRALADVFAVQDEISDAVSAAIGPAVADAEMQRAMRRPPGSLGAWELYQRGMWHMGQRDAAAHDEARRLFERAIELDPMFAAAHAGLSLSYLWAGARDQTGRWTRRHDWHPCTPARRLNWIPPMWTCKPNWPGPWPGRVTWMVPGQSQIRHLPPIQTALWPTLSWREP
jgi:TolB-like protein